MLDTFGNIYVDIKVLTQSSLPVLEVSGSREKGSSGAIIFKGLFYSYGGL